MNAKPLLSTIKARKSQMSITDLKDAFRVFGTRWIVFLNRKISFRAIRDSEANRKNLAKQNLSIIATVRGVSRVSAIRAVKGKVSK